jgi:hypothetical protein
MGIESRPYQYLCESGRLRVSVNIAGIGKTRREQKGY